MPQACSFGLQSQNGPAAVRLQPHKTALWSALGANRSGVNAVPACEPSQKGWRRLRPQEHQKYVRPTFSATEQGPARAAGRAAGRSAMAVLRERFRSKVSAGYYDFSYVAASAGGPFPPSGPPL